jgi:hypothetical protein
MVSYTLYDVGYYIIYKEKPMTKTEQLLLLQNNRIDEINNEIVALRKLLESQDVFKI